MNLKEKVVFITGATGGIGSALAERLAAEGCRLSLTGRHEEKLTLLTSKIQQKESCISQSCDIRNGVDVRKAIEATVQHFGRIDIAVCTAGIMHPTTLTSFSTTSIRDIIETNYLGTINCIEALLPVMKEQKEGIIAVTSTMRDRRGTPRLGAYIASKAALTVMIESIYEEAKAHYNIDFIIIKPCFVQTPMLEIRHPTRGRIISAEQAANYIINGIKQKKQMIAFPFSEMVAIRLYDLIPTFISYKIHIRRHHKKGDK
ncbi:MAG: SDR family oxidoreductase [Candidatus Thermoplasmatota archaeon]